MSAGRERPGERRRQPRRLGDALAEALTEGAPRTPLAAAQTAWAEVAGEAIAAASEPVAERAGTLTVACASGAWAQELEMISDRLLARLGAAIGEGKVEALRFTADLARHRPPSTGGRSAAEDQ